MVLIGEHMEDLKTFYPLKIASNFVTCGLPLAADTYRSCSFNCIYCFSNNRTIMNNQKSLQIANLKWLSNKLNKVYNKKKIRENSLLEKLLRDRITWHCGGMSDPFQHIEKEMNITKQFVDISSEYDISILFSTTSNTYHNCKLNPELHTFQLSISNIGMEKILEPNAPSVKERLSFFNQLKDEGFKVGIRVQPIIPNITSPDIIDLFREADFFIFEFIKLVPQNKEKTNKILKICNLKREDFKRVGGNLRMYPEKRIELFKEFKDKLDEYGCKYSISDKDLRLFTTNKCCCGDPLIKKSSEFDVQYLNYKYGKDYTFDNVLECLGDYKDCNVESVFSSNRLEGCKTILDFYKKRFNRTLSPFSKKFQYNPSEE